jgi:hypothetical protein
VGLEAAEVLCFCRPVGGHSSVWREILEDRTDRLGSFLWNELIEADEMNEMAVFCAFSGCFGLIETNRLTVGWKRGTERLLGWEFRFPVLESESDSRMVRPQ